MNKRLKIISVFLVIFSSAVAQTSADSLLNFIKANPKRSSLYLVQNDTMMAHLNENVIMPLASTVKILVAVEFAKQAANKVFNENEMVPLKELDKYYLPNTDGGAHPNWIAYEQRLGHIKNDSIALINVARGMIIFLAQKAGCSIYEFGPQEIKVAVTGYGKSDKTAVIDMVKRLVSGVPEGVLDDG